MKTVHPYLLFRGNTAEAFEFYESVFQTRVDSRTYYRDFGNPADMGWTDTEGDMLANISLPLTDKVSLMGNDVTDSMEPEMRQGGNVQLTLVPDDADEAHRLFEALSEGGSVRQALGSAPFAELYGEVTDRFGTQWIVIHEGGETPG